MTYHQFVRLTGLVTVIALLLAACTSTTGDDEAVDAAGEPTAETDDDDASDNATPDEDVDVLVEVLGFQSLDEAEVPKVDVETLEAETPARTYQAEAYENAYVGEVTDDLFIGISLDSQYTGQAGEIGVYLCNEQGAVGYLTGELDDGSATLSNEDAEIELTVTDDEVSGTVTIAGEEGQSFSATPATGDAGMYAVTTTVDDVDSWAHWIVLDDGRQRGDFCVKTPLFDAYVCISGAGGKISTK